MSKQLMILIVINATRYRVEASTPTTVDWVALAKTSIGIRDFIYNMDFCYNIKSIYILLAGADLSLLLPLDHSL